MYHAIILSSSLADADRYPDIISSHETQEEAQAACGNEDDYQWTVGEDAEGDAVRDVYTGEIISF